MPVFATHRGPSTDDSSISNALLDGLPQVDPGRLNLLRMELTSEASIVRAAAGLANQLPSRDAHLHTAFFAGGVLHPERQPSDLALDNILETFRLNVISHLLLIKHFSRFLPTATTSPAAAAPLATPATHIAAAVPEPISA